jgi:hypothetical protein
MRTLPLALASIQLALGIARPLYAREGSTPECLQNGLERLLTNVLRIAGLID